MAKPFDLKKIPILIWLLSLTLLVGCEIPSPSASAPVPIDGLGESESVDAAPTSTAIPTDAEPAITPNAGEADPGPGEDGEAGLTATAPAESSVDPTAEPTVEAPTPTEPAESPTDVPSETVIEVPTREGSADPTTESNNEPTADPGANSEPTATIPPPTPVPATPVPPTALPPTVVPPTVAPATAVPQNPAPQTGTEILHTVQPGENLYRIGLRYNVSWTVLQIYNGLPNANAIKVGQVIRIPVIPTPVPGSSSSGTQDGPATSLVHTVVAGETLYLIGLRYGLSWDEIAEANGIMNPASLQVGQQIKIPQTRVHHANEFQHVVSGGENLFSISLRYGVAWNAIAAKNNVFYPYTIYNNQGLTIPVLSQ